MADDFRGGGIAAALFRCGLGRRGAVCGERCGRCFGKGCEGLRIGWGGYIQPLAPSPQSPSHHTAESEALGGPTAPRTTNRAAHGPTLQAGRDWPHATSPGRWVPVAPSQNGSATSWAPGRRGRPAAFWSGWAGGCCGVAAVVTPPRAPVWGHDGLVGPRRACHVGGRPSPPLAALPGAGASLAGGEPCRRTRVQSCPRTPQASTCPPQPTRQPPRQYASPAMPYACLALHDLGAPPAGDLR